MIFITKCVRQQEPSRGSQHDKSLHLSWILTILIELTHYLALRKQTKIALRVYTCILMSTKNFIAFLSLPRWAGLCIVRLCLFVTVVAPWAGQAVRHCTQATAVTEGAPGATILLCKPSASRAVVTLKKAQGYHENESIAGSEWVSAWSSRSNLTIFQSDGD